MRRQASRSLWPYLGLLICLLVMSLAAPRSWYLADRGEWSPGATEQNQQETGIQGPLLALPAAPGDGAGNAQRLVAERFASLIDVLDELSLTSLLPLPPSVPSFLYRAEDWSLPRLGGREESAWTAGVEPRVRGLPVEPSATAEASPPDDSQDTISSPADLAASTEPHVRDERDRLAVRLRLLKRPTGGTPPGESIAAEPPAPVGDVAWLHVEPTSLLERLCELAGSESPQLATWAEGATAEIEQLCRPEAMQSTAIAEGLAALSRLADAAKVKEQDLSQHEQNDLQLSRAAIIRRLAVWNALVGMAGTRPEWQGAGDEFFEATGEVKAATEDTVPGREWRRYLLVDELSEKWQAGPDKADKHVRQLIEQLVDRLENSQLSPAQRALLASEPFASWRERFGDWAAATVDLQTLCKAIEAQEARGGEVYARRIAADARLLSLASDPAARRVASAIDRYYRSSNVRVAIGRAFLQRLIPKQPNLLEPVRETIGGADIAGRSLTETDVVVLLIPDPRTWRIGLEVTGNVASQTAITSGPATFHSAARTDYVARKLVVLSSGGLYSFPAVAGAAAEHMLQGLDTSFDGIPIVEGLVRSVVISQHDANEHQVLTAFETKVSRTARQRLDSQLDQRLHHEAGRVRRSLWTPLVDLGLRPEELALQTSPERLTGECRLAADRQLAAHTPRPYALADSVLSMQIHQSVLNNLVERLELSDRQFTLPELYQHIGATLGKGSVTVPEDVSPSACVHFARFDPIAVAVEDGRVRFSLSLYAVKEGRNRYCDFRVHAYYRPQVEGLTAQLVRDGIIEIEGSYLRPGDHVVLQGVFVSLFSQSRPLPIIPADRNEDPRLAGLMITQLVLEEGWLGVSIGPGHPSRSALMTRIVR